MSEPTIASVSDSLSQVDLPITRRALVERYGQTEVQLANGEIMTLETALTRVEQPTFRSLSDLTLAIGEMRKTGQETHL